MEEKEYFDKKVEKLLKIVSGYKKEMDKLNNEKNQLEGELEKIKDKTSGFYDDKNQELITKIDELKIKDKEFKNNINRYKLNLTVEIKKDMHLLDKYRDCYKKDYDYMSEMHKKLQVSKESYEEAVDLVKQQELSGIKLDEKEIKKYIEKYKVDFERNKRIVHEIVKSSEEAKNTYLYLQSKLDFINDIELDNVEKMRDSIKLTQKVFENNEEIVAEDNDKIVVEDNEEMVVENNEEKVVENNEEKVVENIEEKADNNNVEKADNNNEEKADNNNVEKADNNNEEKAVDNNEEKAVDNNEEKAVEQVKKQFVVFSLEEGKCYFKGMEYNHVYNIRYDEANVINYFLKSGELYASIMDSDKENKWSDKYGEMSQPMLKKLAQNLDLNICEMFEKTKDNEGLHEYIISILKDENKIETTVDLRNSNNIYSAKEIKAFDKKIKNVSNISMIKDKEENIFKRAINKIKGMFSGSKRKLLFDSSTEKYADENNEENKKDICKEYRKQNYIGNNTKVDRNIYSDTSFKNMSKDNTKDNIKDNTKEDDDLTK